MLRRHTPSLFPLEEHLGGDEDEEFEDGQAQPMVNGSSRSRRSHIMSPNSSDQQYAPPSNVPTYNNVYSEFVRRYRSDPVEDSRSADPDSHYYQRGLGQLVDAGDSDEEELGRARDYEGIDRFAVLLLEAETTYPATSEERGRLEWQAMLASVLGGDVLKSEKSRIAVALDASADQENNVHTNIWLGIRARFHGRPVEEEKKKLEERRLRTADALIEDIKNFTIKPPSSSDEDVDASTLKQVNSVLRRLDFVQSLYPNLKTFYNDKPAATHPDFQAHCDALITWSNVMASLRRHVALLRKWTGSDTLDVTQANTTGEIPIIINPNRPTHPGDPSVEIADGSTFVERLLKEDSIQQTFEKGFLTTVHSFIDAARTAQIQFCEVFKRLHLPTFEEPLVPVISFPTKLSQASLSMRLDYVNKLKDPDVLIIDQMTEDLKLNIGLACTLKRQYESFLLPDEEKGTWNVPPCIAEDYDDTILEALTVFFRLLHWKLKSGAKGVYFKETDILDAQWATFEEVSVTVSGGSSLAAEQLCALTNKLMVRVTNYFETQVKVPTAPTEPSSRRERSVSQTQPTVPGQPASRKMTDEQMVSWYGKILDSVRLRYRKLQRFARSLAQRFNNSAEYLLDDSKLSEFIATLVATDHFLVYTQHFEEEGTYVVAPEGLRDRPDAVRRMLAEAFHVGDVMQPIAVVDEDRSPDEFVDDGYEEPLYLLVLSPRSQFMWNGPVRMWEIPHIELDLHDNRVRLIADGVQGRLALAKAEFADIFEPLVDDQGEPVEPLLSAPTCVTEQQSHLPNVNRELRKITRATNRLAESIVDSVHLVRKSLHPANSQELLENWYLFASEHGQHAQKYMEPQALLKFNRALIKLAISWVSFICDDCDPTDRKTFKWAVNALEFTFHRTKKNNILSISTEQFDLLVHKVASCMTLLISHFDILGARSTVEAREKERQEALLQQQEQLNRSEEEEEDGTRSNEPDEDPIFTLGPDPSVRAYWEKITRSLREVDSGRTLLGADNRTIGRVLDTEIPEDRSLVFLASSSSNVSIRWQQGRFIGAGAFGSVYLAVNLDSGSLMAVKEIKFQELSGLPNLYSQIKDELAVMEMLHHENVVEYYGIEVHRDKVYIFEEYCQGGSLASLLEHGRIEDEGIIQVYTMQMLEGVSYLHSKGIVHRDIKPDNILLDHRGVIKFVDFGAAKILAKNQQTLRRSRRLPDPAATHAPPGKDLGGGLGMNNSLTGTPMYMSPEIIKNENRGPQGAMDIWSLGCVVLEFATGKKPWSNLDNEWAIMFHIGVATQHPPLPEPGQLSALGINFIKQCLTIDAVRRPTADQMKEHPWMLEFKEALADYDDDGEEGEGEEEEEPHPHTVGQLAAAQEQDEIDLISAESPTNSPLDTPSGSADGEFS